MPKKAKPSIPEVNRNKPPLKEAVTPATEPPKAPVADPTNPTVRLDAARDAWKKFTAHRQPQPMREQPAVQSGAMGAGPLPMPAMIPGPGYGFPGVTAPYPGVAPQMPPLQPQQTFPWPTMAPPASDSKQGPLFESLGKLMQMGITLATTALSGGMQMMQGMQGGAGFMGNKRRQSEHYDNYSEGDCGCDEGYHHGPRHHEYFQCDCGRCSHVNGC